MIHEKKVLSLNKIPTILYCIQGIFVIYLVLWYMTQNPENQCNMTFMIEPPKFLPMSVQKKQLNSINFEEPFKLTMTDLNHLKYRLYIYSEYGFPHASNLYYDLKDSMPVLFVPGNSGSHMQVRSIASTTLKNQLNSLDAAKFVFYAIDFGGQMSGINGKLMQKQIAFVRLALKMILSSHPTEFKQVIVIGHSAGGFITKAVFNSPRFDRSSVPLLISLASPLKKPFLFFDSDLRDLYAKTKKTWNDWQSRKDNGTIAISVSGGVLDRLVPPNLSEDPQYDLSIRSDNVKDVWIPADHVSITWCREITQKLSRLLSLIVDKTNLKFLDNRSKALEIIESELVEYSGRWSDKSLSILESNLESSKTSSSFASYKLNLVNSSVKFIELDRAVLMKRINMIEIEKVNEGNDILIIVEHLKTLRSNWLYGCEQIIVDAKVECSGHVDLEFLTRSFPSPGHQLEIKLAQISSETISRLSIKYLAFDFRLSSKPTNQPTRILATPEKATIQFFPKDTSIVNHHMNIPKLRNFFMEKYFIRSTSIIINLLIDQREKAIHSIKLDGFESNSQIYKLSLKPFDCKTEKIRPQAIAVLANNQSMLEWSALNQKPSDLKYNKDSFLLPIRYSSAISSLNQKSIGGQISHRVELLLDNICSYHLELTFDLIQMSEYVIQNYLSQMVTIITVLSIMNILKTSAELETSLKSVIDDDFNTSKKNHTSMYCLNIIEELFCCFVVLSISDQLNSVNINEQNVAYNLEARITLLIILYVYSHCFCACLDITSRILIRILYRSHKLLRIYSFIEDDVDYSSSLNKKVKVMNQAAFNERRGFMNKYYLHCIGVFLLASFLSQAIVNIISIFLITNCSLSLETSLSRLTKREDEFSADENFDVTKAPSVNKLGFVDSTSSVDKKKNCPSLAKNPSSMLTQVNLTDKLLGRLCVALCSFELFALIVNFPSSLVLFKEVKRNSHWLMIYSGNLAYSLAFAGFEIMSLNFAVNTQSIAALIMLRFIIKQVFEKRIYVFPTCKPQTTNGSNAFDNKTNENQIQTRKCKKLERVNCAQKQEKEEKSFLKARAESIVTLFLGLIPTVLIDADLYYLTTSLIACLFCIFINRLKRLN